MSKPKRWTSWRVCPECGSRASKMFNLNSGKYLCQICDHEYDPPQNKGKKDGLGWLRFIGNPS